MTLEPMIDSVNHFCNRKGMAIEIEYGEYEDA